MTDLINLSIFKKDVELLILEEFNNPLCNSKNSSTK